MSRIESGVTEKLRYIEETLSKLSEVLLTNKAGSSGIGDHNGQLSSNKKENREGMEGGRQMFSSKPAKLFEYQGTIEAQKVSLASFHLEGEANQWWQWLR